MKKTLIGFIITIATAFTAQAQDLKPVKIDSLVTVGLPQEFQKKDTLGQSIYTGNGSFGYMIVIKAPNPVNQTLKKEKDLNKVFKEYINKVQADAGYGSTILNSKDTIVNNIEVRDFTLRTDNDQGIQLRKFRILYTKPATYTFQVTYPEQRQELAAKEVKQYFDSIKLAPGFDGTDQYTMYGKFTGMHKALKMAIGAGILVVIIIVIIVIRKRRKPAY
ncbi:hypothetical protein [Mucilaginibacter sp. KACC 22063]|uniref:hypothetical protein n=1 Tax=Mucilaginibacter sp. KACC 22063 TaxID=3025666 RepID=UPI002365B9E3|nr:hypothetical protein [Mucilaginibacter sp. KACC 22063]WDF56817.1 hypothetical protein PQ461_07085 [Mucilaginibacter sp. KACC 22063]